MTHKNYSNKIHDIHNSEIYNSTKCSVCRSISRKLQLKTISITHPLNFNCIRTNNPMCIVNEHVIG